MWPLLRDVERLADWDKRIDASPYGSGALAGNTLGLEPVAVARELGFSKVTANSIDGTASRDLVAEFAFIAAMTGVDLSRLSEEIIIWNTQEFAFVRLDDAYSTGSSIMPQKKNPDIAELTRGKSGRLIGDLTGLLATLKGLPTATRATCRKTRKPYSTKWTRLKCCCRHSLAWSPPWSSTRNASKPKPRPVRPRHRHRRMARQERCAVPSRARAFRRMRQDCRRPRPGAVGFDRRGLHQRVQGLPAGGQAPQVREVLSTEGSVSARNGKGGTSPLRVREQIVSAKTTIEQLRAFANSVSDGSAYKSPESLLK